MTEISTRLGRVRGIQGRGYANYLGLAYAAPPVGALRWQPPAPASPWQGVWDATRYPNRAYQPAAPSSVRAGPVPGDLSEDMLYLNVYTPAADGRRRPVLVYIHGGGYSAGSANEFDPSPFARRHDMVVVAMNYRIGLLGFLDLSRYGPTYSGSASLGFQDQVAALRWIAENIDDYGGDPGNVTISGVSAGAGSVLALLGAPAARGLFHKAISFSPAEIAAQVPDLLTGLAGALQQPPEGLLAHLQGLSGEQIFQTQVATGIAGSAAVDGVFIQKTVTQAVRSRMHEVPLMVGNCIAEGTLLTAAMDEHSAQYDPSYAEMVLAGIAATVGNGDAARYLKLLDSVEPGSTLKARMTRLWYDYFRASVLRAAQAYDEVGMPAWVYSFQVPTEHPFGPTHAADMVFSYNLLEADDAVDGAMFAFHRNTAENRRIAAQWTDTIARFMRTGDPNGDGFPYWPAYTRASGTTLALREAPVIVERFDACQACLAYGLQPPVA